MNTVRRVAVKSVWPLVDRLTRLVLSVVVGVVVARYLGAEQFGLLSFALAWASFFGAFAWLGLGEPVTRDLVRHPEQRDRIVSTVAGLRLIGAVASVVLAVALLPAVYPETAGGAIVLVAVIGVASVFGEPGGAATLWMVASARTELIATTRTLPHLLSQIFRLGLVFAGASLVWFAVAIPLEAALLLVLSWSAYRRHTGSTLWPAVDVALARRLLVDAMPMLLAALATNLSLRLDQMMLAGLADLSAVGVYAGALRFSEVWWIVPAAVMQVAAPMLLFGQDDAQQRRRYLLLLYGVSLATSVALAALMTVVGGPLVRTVLGPGFAGADAVLVIHIWTAVFVFVDAVTSNELVRQGQQRLVLLRACVVLAVNVLLNALWIPSHGAVGAAWATLVAMATGTVVWGLLFAPTRVLLGLQAMAIPWLLREAIRRCRVVPAR